MQGRNDWFWLIVIFSPFHDLYLSGWTPVFKLDTETQHRGDARESFCPGQLSQLDLKSNGTDLRGERAEPKHGKKVSQAGFE